MLEAKNISLSINGKTLLDNIGLRLCAGEFICLAGPNGSGKTLLLRVLCGLLKPTRGAVFYDDTDIAPLSARERSKILRLLPARPENVFNYSARDIALMGINPYMEWWRDYSARDYAAALAALESTGTAALAGRGVFTLSDGELQRVFIAQALAGEAAVILPDEPTSHLDLKQKDIIFKLFSRIARAGRAVICATHDLELAKKYAARICLLNAGRLRGDVPASQLSEEMIKKVYDI